MTTADVCASFLPPKQPIKQPMKHWSQGCLFFAMFRRYDAHVSCKQCVSVRDCVFECVHVQINTNTQVCIYTHSCNRHAHLSIQPTHQREDEIEKRRAHADWWAVYNRRFPFLGSQEKFLTKHCTSARNTIMRSFWLAMTVWWQWEKREWIRV